jgi:hypothetical protein
MSTYWIFAVPQLSGFGPDRVPECRGASLNLFRVAHIIFEWTVCHQRTSVSGLPSTKSTQLTEYADVSLLYSDFLLVQTQSHRFGVARAQVSRIATLAVTHSNCRPCVSCVVFNYSSVLLFDLSNCSCSIDIISTVSVRSLLLDIRRVYTTSSPTSLAV